MTAKKIFGIVLLAFVVVSLAVLAAKELRRADEPKGESIPEAVTGAPAPTAPAEPAGHQPPGAEESHPIHGTTAPCEVPLITTAAGATAPAGSGAAANAAAPPPLAEGQRKIIVYYFHGKVRCATCIKIENYTREAVETGFKEQVAKNLIEFRVVDVDEPDNRHFVAEYLLYTKTVVLSAMEGTKQLRWKNLEKIWELQPTKEVFIKYIQNEITAFMAGN
jgi:hypothetical protein